MAIETIRAPLFVPANRPERFAKASASSADAVILDLEDAVAPEAKEEARLALSSDFTDKPIIVRINGTDTPDHAADLEAVAALNLSAIMLPKAESPDSITAIQTMLGGEIPVMALIETAVGLARAREIAATPATARLVFGSIDYCADLGCDHDRTALLAARSELVFASRLAGLSAPIDGVTAQLSDPELTFEDARHAKMLGMAGKLCIHPRQIDAVLRAFTPSDDEVNWARRVLASGDGAVSVDGAMIDAPVRQRARQILAALQS
ncbi:CoA ester lyase [uncultured Cohaesibacter sp.]|uniref:HpcH/HpaI aldolase/citrate lyase family protein n=1 Tax=uncultured Cohaesibacter sp. TaxID=1002546 RepID=UPI0029C863D5|nr:CoA ester lyase [uncultured Cohaesibacter sp.]